MKKWFAVQSDMELNMFYISNSLKIEYFEEESFYSQGNTVCFQLAVGTS
jgi:hypothetical protein